MTEAAHLDISRDLIYNVAGDFGSFNLGLGHYPSRLYFGAMDGLQSFEHDDFQFVGAAEAEDAQRDNYGGEGDGNRDSGNIRFASDYQASDAADLDHLNLIAGDFDHSMDGGDNSYNDMGFNIVQASIKKVPFPNKVLKDITNILAKKSKSNLAKGAEKGVGVAKKAVEA